MVGIFLKDPKVVKVLDRLIERLKNLDEWRIYDSDNDYIHHKDFNIRISKDRIAEPEHVWIYYRYWHHRKIIKQAIASLSRIKFVNRLDFIYDIIDGKYSYQRHIGSLIDEQKAWLIENAKEGEYLYRNFWLYFADETLAMAYKLKFE